MSIFEDDDLATLYNNFDDAVKIRMRAEREIKENYIHSKILGEIDCSGKWGDRLLAIEQFIKSQQKVIDHLEYQIVAQVKDRVIAELKNDMWLEMGNIIRQELAKKINKYFKENYQEIEFIINHATQQTLSIELEKFDLKFFNENAEVLKEMIERHQEKNDCDDDHNVPASKGKSNRILKHNLDNLTDEVQINNRVFNERFDALQIGLHNVYNEFKAISSGNRAHEILTLENKVNEKINSLKFFNDRLSCLESDVANLKDDTDN